MISNVKDFIGSSQNLSHKRRKAEWKKAKRKKKRQILAQIRDENERIAELKRLKSASYREFLAQKEKQDQLEEHWQIAESERKHELWLERERLAKADWITAREKKEWERERKIEEDKRIKEEWEERLKKEKEDEEAKRKEEEGRKEKQDSLLKEAMSGERKNKEGDWHNPIAPMNYGTDQREKCQFFMKTGACRFGDRCSRHHPPPEDSCTLLFPGMYSHFELGQGLADPDYDMYDTDVNLEFEESEMYQHFREFYHDVLPEFKVIGKVIQFKVCCNYEPHLRGNVYVQFLREEDAQRAFLRFNGRFYGGRRLQGEFCVVNKWKSAICGQYHKKTCPKGKNCNFLHVFKNPGNAFWKADQDIEEDNSRRNWSSRREIDRSRSSIRHSRSSRYRERSRSPWYRSPKRKNRSRSRSPRKRYRSRSKGRSPSNRNRSRSRSRSPRNRRSKSQSRRRISKSPQQRKSRSQSPNIDKSADRIGKEHNTKRKHKKKKKKKHKKHKQKDKLDEDVRTGSEKYPEGNNGRERVDSDSSSDVESEPAVHLKVTMNQRTWSPPVEENSDNELES